MDVCLLCVLLGRGLCDELLTRSEEFYRLWCVVVCDIETSRMRKPWPTGAVAPNEKVVVISSSSSSNSSNSSSSGGGGGCISISSSSSSGGGDGGGCISSGSSSSSGGGGGCTSSSSSSSSSSGGGDGGGCISSSNSSSSSSSSSARARTHTFKIQPSITHTQTHRLSTVYTQKPVRKSMVYVNTKAHTS